MDRMWKASSKYVVVRVFSEPFLFLVFSFVCFVQCSLPASVCLLVLLAPQRGDLLVVHFCEKAWLVWS